VWVVHDIRVVDGVQEIGEEKFCVRFPSYSVYDMAFSPALQRAAIIG
jgi:hypothetical protein